ncbi:TetR/AcrR family transcriptional regulator [Nocardioides marmoriginsengisoli]|uniref:TetR/AcrR family transcriptional regulator n=1 Tax=Nocardioides marmoriginsengisoli TaxID=661483 RepID=A0A3N0CAR0_9ACTN|nr:TetR/AcrR family transcriptional regulator [Nocardioides marmoriginsengisoli]RNL60399.1 TetR/AcrR family transcriptional regulator [Nocardioides marmoriginsengisoli]
MPRISAATIAEHVAHQEAAVIDAARRLFDARGYQQVSLRDIAEEVGLSRTSLYRYFPTKAHLVQGWFEAAMVPLVDASAAAVAGDGSAADRLDRWLVVQLDFILDDEHTALVSASLASEDLPDEVREHIGARHRELYATLVPLLEGPAGADRALVRTRTLLIAGLVRSAADLVRAGVARDRVDAELSRSALAVAELAPGRRG